MNARQRRIRAAASAAAQSFANHEVNVVYDYGQHKKWECRNRNGSSNYYFSVALDKYHAVVLGDLGTLVIHIWDDNPLSWLRTSVRDHDYLAGKVVPEIAVKEFDPEVAKEWLDEQVSEEIIDLTVATSLKLYLDGCSEHEFHQALFDSGVIKNCDFPNLTNYTWGFLWQVEGLKWLLARI